MSDTSTQTASKSDYRDADKAAAALTLATTRDQDDRLDLRYGWRCKDPKREASHYLLLLNGRTEWAEKYAYVAEHLKLAPDCGFLTWDHRGQGASGGARAYVDDYLSFDHDAAKIVKEVVGDKPYTIIAHSMGGLIALDSVLRGLLKPRAMVLSSPLLGLPNTPLPRQVSRPVAAAMALLGLGTLSSGAGSFAKIPFARNRLTHDEILYKRLQDCDYKIPGATFGWVQATFHAIAHCFSPAALQALKTPTLVLGGTQESVVDPQALNAWVQAATATASAPVQLRLFPGARHELLSEIEPYYGQALAAIQDWFKIHGGDGWSG